MGDGRPHRGGDGWSRRAARLHLARARAPLTLYREELKARGILSSAEARARKAGQKVQVAGLVVVHQAPPTANGVHFITLEDEGGLIELAPIYVEGMK